jgi:PST family polysaccharide transporter
MRSKAINGVMWSALENWGNRFISIGVFFLLARLLGPEAFGLVATATLVTDFLSIFLDQGFSQSIIQRKNVDAAYLSTAFWINIVFSILLFVSGLLFAGHIAVFFGEPELEAIIRWISISFLLGGLSNVQEAILTRNLAFKVLSARSLLASVISGIVGIIAAFMGLGAWSLVIKQLVFSSVKTIAVWGLTTWRPSFSFSKAYVKELYSFGSNIMGFRVLNFSQRRSSDFLISYFLGTKALGLYAVAYRLIIVIVDLFVGIIQRVALPAFARLQGDSIRLKAAFFEVTELTSMVCFPLFSGLALLAPELTSLIFGEEWNQSVVLMQILAMVGLLQSITAFNASVILALGKPEWLLKLKMLESTITILGFFIGLHWGLIGVSISFVISSYMLAPVGIGIIGSRLEFGFWQYIARYKETVAAISISMTIAILVKVNLIQFFNIFSETLILVLVGGIFGIIYISSLLLFKPHVKKQVFAVLKAKLSSS